MKIVNEVGMAVSHLPHIRKLDGTWVAAVISDTMIATVNLALRRRVLQLVETGIYNGRNVWNK